MNDAVLSKYVSQLVNALFEENADMIQERISSSITGAPLNEVPGRMAVEVVRLSLSLSTYVLLRVLDEGEMLDPDALKRALIHLVSKELPLQE
ncbi:MAG: hypothetical protein IJ680_06795 [Paludibacteraceae bacterium]|nr:hypothetical protein [Paludibacteraceae bacterium]